MPGEAQPHSRLPRSKSVQSLRTHAAQLKDPRAAAVVRSTTAQGSLRAAGAAPAASASSSTGAVAGSTSISTSAIARPAPRLPPSPTSKAFKVIIAPVLPPSPTTTKTFKPVLPKDTVKTTTTTATTRPRPLHKVTSLPRLAGMGKMASSSKDADTKPPPKAKDKKRAPDAGKENAAVTKRPPVPPLPAIPTRADSPEKAVRAAARPRLSDDSRGLFAPPPSRKTAAAAPVAAPSLFSGPSIRIPRPRIKLGAAAAAPASPSMPSPSPSPLKAAAARSPAPPRSVSTSSSRTASAGASTPFLAQIASSPAAGLASSFSSALPHTPGARRTAPTTADTPTISALLEREHAADLSLIDEGDVSLASGASFDGLTPPPPPPRRALRTQLSEAQEHVTRLSEAQEQVIRLEEENCALEARVARVLAEEARLLRVIEQAHLERDAARSRADSLIAEKNAAMWESVLKAADEAIDEERNLLATIGCLREMVAAL